MSKLIAYRLNRDRVSLRRCARTRHWMEAYNKFAYKCLPLVMANQNGWELCTEVEIKAVWDGGPSTYGVRITNACAANRFCVSHFGNGILTFNLPYLFRTEPGVDLVVTGPANFERQTLLPREGIVETWWNPFTFTMNWMFALPNVPYTFAAGDPICRIYPIPHGYVETFEPEIRDIASDPDLHRRFAQWSKSRQDFTNWQRATPGELGVSWQKHYFQGIDFTNNDEQIKNHKSAFKIKDFVDMTPPTTVASKLPETLNYQLRCLAPRNLSVEEMLRHLNLPNWLEARGGEPVTPETLLSAWRELWAYDEDTRFMLWDDATKRVHGNAYETYAAAESSAAAAAKIGLNLRIVRLQL